MDAPRDQAAKAGRVGGEHTVGCEPDACGDREYRRDERRRREVQHERDSDQHRGDGVVEDSMDAGTDETHAGFLHFSAWMSVFLAIMASGVFTRDGRRYSDTARLLMFGNRRQRSGRDLGEPCGFLSDSCGLAELSWRNADHPPEVSGELALVRESDARGDFR